MDAEDLERETATERFVAGRGSRETAEAQTVSADPMVDRLEIQGAVSTRQRLGAQGLPQLLEQGRERRAQHDASMHELGDGTESVASSLQQTRIGMDSYYARYGEEVTEQRQLTRSLDDVRSAVQEASAVAQWDATQLGEFESAAASAVKAVRPGSQSETDARGSFDAARAKVAAAVSRAQQDSQWMESLLPHTEAIIEEAIGAGNKTVMPDRTRLATVAKLAKGNVAALLRITKKLGNAAQTDFVLDGEGCSPSVGAGAAEVESIRVLCARLDGLPLAIELAAARVQVVGLDQLATAILEGDTGRSTRSRPERHRDLQAVLQWSIDLLDEAATTVLRRLALFEGGFTGDAAVSVVSDDVLPPRAVRAALADASIVQTERTDAGIRFRLLETVRSVAHDLLVDHGELDRTALAHLDWITEWSARSGIVRLDRAGWLGDRREVANQRVGLRHALRLGRVTHGAELLARAAWSLTLSGFVTETQDTLQCFRVVDGADDPDTATLLDLAELAVVELVGDFVRSHELALRFAASDDRTLAATGASVATHHLAATNPQEGRLLLGQYESRHGPIPHTTFLHGEIALGEGRFADAVGSMLDALDIRAVTDLGRGAPPDSGIVVDLTVALLALDRLDEATLALESAPDDETGGAADGPLLGAAIAASRGETDVVGDLRHAFDLEVRFGIPLVDLDCLVMGAHVAVAVDRPEVAAMALGATRGQPQRALSMFAIRRMLRGRLQAALGDAEFRRLTESGAGRRPRDAFSTLIEKLAAPA